jgi:two-component system NtrC family sensor kinase
LDNARLYEDLKQSLVEKERAQAQLIQSEKIAALGRLAVSVAHEINNPLQAVQGCLSLLVEEFSGPQRPEKVNSYLNIVDKEIGRVAGIVQEMRDFARPAPSGTRPTDVISVLEDVLGLAGKQLQQSKVIVERSWSIDVPTIQANPNLLKQVFLNMILNAIDAMTGGGTLRISAVVDQLKPGDGQEPQAAVRVEFSDTGHGMSAQDLSRLFEPFYTTKEHGSGLGLYISYTIIQSLGGKIEVSSTVNHGSTFAILLPLKKAD